MVINFEVHSTVIKRPPLRNYGGTNSSLSAPRCQVAPQTRGEMFTVAFKILACPGLQSTNGPRIRLTQETLPELLNIRDQRVAFLETMKAPRWHNRPPFTERKLLPKDIHLGGAAVRVICKDIPYVWGGLLLLCNTLWSTSLRQWEYGQTMSQGEDINSGLIQILL